MAGNGSGNTMFGKKTNQITTPKSGQVGEPPLSQYGHEGLRGVIMRASQPKVHMDGSAVAPLVIKKSKFGK